MIKKILLRVLNKYSTRIHIQDLHENNNPYVVSIYDNTQLKIIEQTKPLKVWVLSRNQYNPILHTHKTVKYKVWRVLFDDDSVLYGADHHLIMDGLNVIKLCDLKVSQLLQGKRVMAIDMLDNDVNMFDLELSGNNKTYYTNTILSHNSTTIAAGFMLHRIVFGDHEKWAILANKGVIAREILSRLKMAFEYLPLWIKPGVLEWNKGKITLDNGCSVIAESTGGDALRGLSCLNGDQTVTIKDTVTGIIEELTLSELEQRLTQLKE